MAIGYDVVGSTTVLRSLDLNSIVFDTNGIDLSIENLRRPKVNSSEVYTFNMVSDVDGEKIVDVADTCVADLAGNRNTRSNKLHWIRDTVPPVATLSSTALDDLSQEICEENAPDICSRHPCLAYYAFEENARDDSGSARHGTEHGNAAFGPGYFGNALHISGNAWIEIPENAWLGNHATWTFATFLKCTQCSMIYMEHASPSNSHINTLHAIPGSIFDNFPPGGGNQFRGNSLYETRDKYDDAWYHVAWVKRGNDKPLNFYVNGVNVGEEDYECCAEQPANQDNIWGIIGGYRREHSRQYFQGQIDEVYMMSDDLNDDEVRTLYEEYVVFEREARVIQTCHSLQHVLRCEKYSNSLVSLTLSLIAYSFATKPLECEY